MHKKGKEHYATCVIKNAVHFVKSPLNHASSVAAQNLRKRIICATPAEEYLDARGGLALQFSGGLERLSYGGGWHGYLYTFAPSAPV